MARAALTPVSATQGGYPSAGVVATPAASDHTNGNKVAMSGKDLVIVTNSDVSSHTVSFTSVADAFGRLGSITTEAVAAGVTKVFGPFGKPGWAQSDGSLYIDTSDNTIMIAVVRL